MNSAMHNNTIPIHNVLYHTEPHIILNYISNDSTIIYIARSEDEASSFFRMVQFLIPEKKSMLFPSWDVSAFEYRSPSQQRIAKRFLLLNKLKNEDYDIIILTPRNFLQKLYKSCNLHSVIKEININDKLSHEEFVDYLISSGYSRVDELFYDYDFTVRGSVIDIQYKENHIYRFNYTENTIDYIADCKLIGNEYKYNEVNSCIIPPISEVLLDNAALKVFKKEYINAFNNYNYLQDFVNIYERISGIENFAPLFLENDLVNITDYINRPIKFISHGNLHKKLYNVQYSIKNSLISYEKKSNNSISIKNHNYILDKLYSNTEEIDKILSKHEIIELYRCDESTKSNSINETINNQKYYTIPNLYKIAKKEKIHIVDVLLEYAKNKNIIIACSSNGSLEVIKEIFLDKGLNPKIIGNIEDFYNAKETNGLFISELNISNGFECNQYAFIVDISILGKNVARESLKTHNTPNSEDIFSGFAYDDIVVHSEYGIGLFKGFKLLEIKNVKHEFIIIEYAENSKVFLPAENADLLSLYMDESQNTKLDKLGSNSWKGRKLLASKNIMEIADEIVKISAQRNLHKIQKLNIDTYEYEKFISEFPYKETQDQINTINDIETDLKNGILMDRLICGDAGFGKTEIALRASFILANNGFQVAIITPTTLLCKQHAETFYKRFSGHNITVSHLSRNTNAKEQDNTLSGLADGSIKIVVGTHKLLSKKINFKNIGMVIIDEEHQFGVKQKEYLKKLSKNLHILTISATPIPRTLQLSLVGIRDISMITTPPFSASKIYIKIIDFDFSKLSDVIDLEVKRNGQIFIVVPRIADLPIISKQLKNYFPNVRFAIAHGQMNKDNFEKVTTDFYENKYTILLSTSIVESGIHIPNANTMIVYNAHLFGTAQLYQLRGRVGRTAKSAYVYFIVQSHITENISPELQDSTYIEKHKQKHNEIMKRLEMISNAIKKNIGVGLALAHYDMNIRGFGNILGKEQSGNIKFVGVELYHKMMQEAIEKIQNNENVTKQKEFIPKVNLTLPIYISPKYVENTEERSKLYKEIANAKNNEKIEAIKISITNKYGNIPTEVHNLLKAVELKQLCYKALILELQISHQKILITFNIEALTNADKLFDYIIKHPQKFIICGNETIELLNKQKDIYSSIQLVKVELDEIINIIKST